LLNAMVGEIDDMNLDGIAIRCAFARTASADPVKATASFQGWNKGET